MASHSSKIRILCLHGWMQNADIMTRNMDPIIKRFEGPVEFVIITGPQELPPTIRGGRPSKAPLATWVLPKLDDEGNLIEMERFDEAIQYLVDFIEKNGPFDGILGFSQGAGMSVLLLLILSQEDWRKRFHIPTDLPQFRLAIIIAGFKYATPNFAEFYARDKITTPTLHVYSPEDTVITAERTLEMIDSQFTDVVHSVHNLGHRIVATPELIKDYERFFHRFVYIQPTTSL